MIPIKDFINATSKTIAKNFGNEVGTLVEFRLKYTWLKAQQNNCKMLNASRINDSLHLYLTTLDGMTEVVEVDIFEHLDKEMFSMMSLVSGVEESAILEQFVSMLICDIAIESGAIVDVPCLMLMNSDNIPKDFIISELKDIKEMVVDIETMDS